MRGCCHRAVAQGVSSYRSATVRSGEPAIQDARLLRIGVRMLRDRRRAPRRNGVRRSRRATAQRLITARAREPVAHAPLFAHDGIEHVDTSPGDGCAVPRSNSVYGLGKLPRHRFLDHDGRLRLTVVRDPARSVLGVLVGPCVVGHPRARPLRERFTRALRPEISQPHRRARAGPSRALVYVGRLGGARPAQPRLSAGRAGAGAELELSRPSTCTRSSTANPRRAGRDAAVQGADVTFIERTK